VLQKIKKMLLQRLANGYSILMKMRAALSCGTTDGRWRACQKE
jgi:hypothetical protein